MAQRAVRVEDEPVQIEADLAIIEEVENNPIIALTDQAKFDAYFAAIEAQARSVPVDLSSSAGRDKIKSAAAQIARKKVAIDNAGKSSTEEWRRLTAKVNEARNTVKERFDELRDEIRKPVTEWENAEDARIKEADLIIDNLRKAQVIEAHLTSDDIDARLLQVRGRNLNPELFGPRLEMVTDLRDETVVILQAAYERVKKQEDDAAELDRLRREAAERDERDRQEKAAREAKEAEDRRKADEEARITREREEAAERARVAAEEAAATAQREREELAERQRIEAEQARQAEIDRIEREKQAEVDAANERTRRVEQEAFAERQRIEQEKAAQEAEERRRRDEQDKREADQAHRSEVMGAAKQAIMAYGVPETKAKAVVLAIAAGNVPHVSIAF